MFLVLKHPSVPDSLMCSSLAYANTPAAVALPDRILAVAWQVSVEKMLENLYRVGHSQDRPFVKVNLTHISSSPAHLISYSTELPELYVLPVTFLPKRLMETGKNQVSDYFQVSLSVTALTLVV